MNRIALLNEKLLREQRDYRETLSAIHKKKRTATKMHLNTSEYNCKVKLFQLHLKSEHHI